MQEPFLIKKVAVLGAGVMGAQIAAQCVNAKVETLLFDLSTKEGSHALIEKSIAQLSKLKPAPLATPDTALYLKPCNYEDNLEALRGCDLVIEAIAERLDWKEDLYRKISPYLASSAILVSNTSGISINALANVLPEARRASFCGMHFFNPPRYMHLAELIPAKHTPPTLVDQLETWLTSRLGKGVVRAKDTPNFIANRVGVFSLLVALYHAEKMGMGLDEVDAITGTVLGRPKSATFRTMDVVGLDTMQHVIHTMSEYLKEDPWHSFFRMPGWLLSLIEAGNLGQKTGAGLYRKQGKIFEVYDIETRQYRLAQTEISVDLKKIMHITDDTERLKALFASENPQARFLAACFRDLFHYSAYHLEEIADTVRDVDLAMRWGYGWKQGPFETWQLSGVAQIREFITKGIAENETMSGVLLPPWVVKVSEFYTSEGAYSPANNAYIKRNSLPVYLKQIFPDRVLKESIIHTETWFENEGIRLWHLKNDIGVVSFKTKANTIDQSVLDGMNEALDRVEKRGKGLIIYQSDANNFSSGADLKGVLTLIQNNKMSALDNMIRDFQQVAMRLKYNLIPTVAAIRGRVLGGGCELMMHCTRIVAAFESYPGLVEAGVGVIPAGGGSKEAALRAAEKVGKADLLTFLQPYFEQIATAFIAGSAPEAFQRGYLRPGDVWLMHKNEVLNAAFAQIKALQAANYSPPLLGRFKVAGREGHARLQVGLVNWLEGGFISQYDYFLANQLALVLCGGEVNEGQQVDEAWLLKLEREAFMRLVANPLTQARIDHLLETGKPLRN